jgi:hypothetical protein
MNKTSAAHPVIDPAGVYAYRAGCAKVAAAGLPPVSKTASSAYTRVMNQRTEDKNRTLLAGRDDVPAAVYLAAIPSRSPTKA